MKLKKKKNTTQGFEYYKEQEYNSSSQDILHTFGEEVLKEKRDDTKDIDMDYLIDTFIKKRKMTRR